MFFFQAEDGIRDAQESRGLGDVYKRQHIAYPHRGIDAVRIACLYLDSLYKEEADLFPPEAVSYTHLTLPTIYSV